jgi:hypothetical protein
LRHALRLFRVDYIVTDYVHSILLMMLMMMKMMMMMTISLFIFPPGNVSQSRCCKEWRITAPQQIQLQPQTIIDCPENYTCIQANVSLTVPLNYSDIPSHNISNSSGLPYTYLYKGCVRNDECSTWCDTLRAKYGNQTLRCNHTCCSQDLCNCNKSGKPNDYELHLV